MTESPAGPDASAEVAMAVRNLMPGLKAKARTAFLGMIASMVAAGLLAYLSLTSGMEGEDRWKFALFAAFIAVLIAVGLAKWAVKAQEALVMPVVAQAVGLTYRKDAKAFVKGLPKRLLPARGIRSGEDHVQGSLGAHAIQMAEVKVETGGKNSRTLFQGIVAQFPNRIAMPAFFLALEDKTKPGFFFGGDLGTEGLHHLRNVQGPGGQTYGIWTSWSAVEEPPALTEVVDILTRLEAHVGPSARLYAATSNGVEMHVALTHARNLFRVGGLAPQENEIFADVRRAMQDLTVPLTLAKALIGAEETAGKTRA
jgi:hypothetical protein